MKIRIAALLLICTVIFMALPSLHAQLVVRAQLGQTNYLEYDSVFIQVSIRNNSAHAIAFGNLAELKGGLKFEIRNETGRDRRYIPLSDPKVTPPLTGIIIPPGATQEFTFDICDYYNIHRVGSYSIRAVVTHHLFRNEYISPVLFFNIVPGVNIWSTKFGMPELIGKPDVKNKKVEQRTYRIVSLYTGKIHVFNLIVEDENRIYANRRFAYNLGAEFKPQFVLDFLSRLHVLAPASNRVFAYYVFDPDGKLQNRRVVIKEGGKPVLVSDPKNGYVTLVGGRDAIPDQDYEEIKNIPFLGSKPHGAAVVTPPKGDAIKQLDAIQE